jgi:predicted O-methyltransferase YrrM
MLQQVKRWVPAPIRRVVHDRRDERLFRRLPVQACAAEPLAAASEIDLKRVFRDPRIDADWPAVEARVADLGITSAAAGVNVGDRRALYFLVRHLDPRNVLEVGTHIGASTVHIASALMNGSHPDFTLRTVDIWDVNDPANGQWRRLGSTLSPADMMRRLACAERVEFFAEDSLLYLARCRKRFDFISLDGEHSAGQVYREVPLALELLEDGGHILLHDYFPEGRPLWSNRRVVPGPFQAIERLRAEGAPLKVLPLGALPWPTKLGSNMTSLALLCRDE